MGAAVAQGLPVRSPTDRRGPQRSDQRRAAILEALNHHLMTSGFDAINIADVATRAGVTRSAFYFYFENKAAAVAALMEPMYDDVLAANEILTGTEEAPMRRVRKMLDALLQTGDRHRYLFQAMLEARATSTAVRELWDSGRESFIPTVAAMIAAERATGRAPAGPDATVLATVLVDFNDRLLERYTLGAPLTREQLIEGAEAIWLRSIYGTTHDIHRFDRKTGPS